MLQKQYDNTRTKKALWNSTLGWARMTAIHGVICATRGYCADRWTDDDLYEARELAEKMNILGLPERNRGPDGLKSIFDNGRRGDKSWGNKFPPVVNERMSRGQDGGRPTKKNPQRVAKKKKTPKRKPRVLKGSDVTRGTTSTAGSA